MGSKKKKKMLMTSLSRGETMPIPENGSCGDKGTIGCMSGIFHFLSRHHHSHSRKRLPSASRKKQPVSSSQKETMLPPEQTNATLPEKEEETTFRAKEIRRHSCEVQRSPTLPSGIRRLSSVDLSLDSPRRPSPLVVRLMGLDDIPVSSPESAADKRRKLLGALEKCDEDLKSLKRIIDAVRVADKRRKTVEDVVVSLQREEGEVEDGSRDNKRASYGEIEDGELSMETVKSVDSVGEQPSPVSVLQSISSPTYGSNRSKNENQKGSPISPIQLKSPEPFHLCISGYSDKNKQDTKQSYPSSIFHQITIERLPPPPKRRERKLLEEFGWAKRVTETGKQSRRRWECMRSHALVESVCEVWEEGVWEERREYGRVGVGIERGIFRELVDEFVREMLGGCCLKGLSSQGSCRKRLCF